MSLVRTKWSVGLALVAALLFSAVAAGSALAAGPGPEFVSPFPNPFTSSGGAGELNTTGGQPPVKCEANTNVGEIANGQAVNKVKVTFTGCKTTLLFTVACTSSGQPSGTIVTNNLTGTLVTLPLSTEKERKEHTGILLRPESGAEFAKFTCGGVETITVTTSIDSTGQAGGLVGELKPVNVKTKTATLVLEEVAAGVQRWTSYLDRPECKLHTGVFLLSSGSGLLNFSNVQSGILPTGAQDVITAQNEVEISTANNC